MTKALIILSPNPIGPRPVLVMSWLSSLWGVLDKGEREQSGWILWSFNHPPKKHLKGREALGLNSSLLSQNIYGPLEKAGEW